MGVDQETSEAVVVVTPLPQAPETPAHFRRYDSDEPASIVLRQSGPAHFELVESFRYVGRRGTWSVTPTDLSATDLASIPQFLSWFVSRYGKHTFAALLHDHLVRNGEYLTPPVARHEADEVFRDALDDLGVPYLRSRIMWAAVTFATRWGYALWARLTLVLWIVAMGLGIGGFVWAAATWQPNWMGLCALAPVPSAVLWGRRELKAGIFGGYTLWLVMLPAALNIVAYAVYWVAESLLRLATGLRPSKDASRIPKPPSYNAR